MPDMRDVDLLYLGMKNSALYGNVEAFEICYEAALQLAHVADFPHYDPYMFRDIQQRFQQGEAAFLGVDEITGHFGEFYYALVNEYGMNLDYYNGAGDLDDYQSFLESQWRLWKKEQLEPISQSKWANRIDKDKIRAAIQGVEENSGRYVEMVDFLFSKGQHISEETLRRYCSSLPENDPVFLAMKRNLDSASTYHEALQLDALGQG